MPNTYFQFQQFLINQEMSGMKVTTDACLFGAWVADEVKKNKEPKRILDIGGGTGLLPLMLAQETTHSEIDAVEINLETYKEARSNINGSLWRDRITIHHSSIQEFSTNHRYEVILSNPPFFSNSQKGLSENKNQALHNANLTMEDLLNSLLAFLTVKGTFYLLFPEREMDQFIELAEKAGLFPAKLVTIRNRVNESVFRKMARFELQNSLCEKSEIIIRSDVGKYTYKFWKLLKDFYLDYNDPKLI